jgi:hypothetical protein
MFDYKLIEGLVFVAQEGGFDKATQTLPSGQTAGGRSLRRNGCKG